MVFVGFALRVGNQPFYYDFKVLKAQKTWGKNSESKNDYEIVFKGYDSPIKQKKSKIHFLAKNVKTTCQGYSLDNFCVLAKKLISDFSCVNDFSLTPAIYDT